MHRAWQIINDEKRRDLAATGLRGLARAAALGYGLAAGLNQWSYDLGWRKVVKMPVPVIGIGNITVGGTGKTPLTMAVAQTLLTLGHKVAIISRGYGRENKAEASWVSYGQGPVLPARQSGDEPYLLASRLPVAVLVGSDRVKLAKAAIARLGRVVIVGDDLFQHRRLYRDLDIVALDAGNPLGNGFMLPRGPMREPASALRRAQAIVLTRADNEPASRQTRVWLRSFWGSGPVLQSRHQPTGVFTADGRAVDDFSQKPVLAFCGLARPQAFADSLREQNMRVVGLKSFADHHWYNDVDLAGLEQLARDLGAQALLTTEKDMARLPEHRVYALPLWVSAMQLKFAENRLAGLLKSVVVDAEFNR